MEICLITTSPNEYFRIRKITKNEVRKEFDVNFVKLKLPDNLTYDIEKMKRRLENNKQDKGNNNDYLSDDYLFLENAILNGIRI